MKKLLLMAGIGVLLISLSVVVPSCGTSARKGTDTLKVNTTELGAKIIGYNGPTPVEISVYQGTITKIEALPNQETPRFFQRVLDSGLLDALVGKTVEEAKAVHLDAVTGATYSSKAVIKNIQLGLDNVGKPVQKKAKTTR